MDRLREGDSRVQYLNASGSAERYGFSTRHWLRLVDSGKAPQPTRFGRLTRWSLKSLEEWEADGCRPVRPSQTTKLAGCPSTLTGRPSR
jgi:predicted DNA-binding transcriptional regulator AlpA